MEIVITDKNYSEYASQNKPMMIDFSATWCGPCKKMAPIIEELGKKYDGRIIVGKVDVDENPEITSQFGIRNIPTILFFKDGQVVDKAVGAIPASDVEVRMEKLL